MPTAVEYIERILKSFLKLEIDNRFEQHGLDDALSHLDADFRGLAEATTTAGIRAANRAASGDIRRIADAFSDTGEDLSRLSRISLGLDQVLGKLVSAAPPVTTAAATTSGGVHLQDDFLTLDHALSDSGQGLQLFGQDILKMDGSVRIGDFGLRAQAAARDAVTLTTELGDDQIGFEKLSDDFLTLSHRDSSGAPANPLDFNLGAALHAVALDFGQLQQDFRNIGAALRGLGGGVGTSEVSHPLTPGSALSAANSDFVNLSHDLTGLAGPTAAGIVALIQRAYGGGGGTAFP